MHKVNIFQTVYTMRIYSQFPSFVFSYFVSYFNGNHSMVMLRFTVLMFYHFHLSHRVFIVLILVYRCDGVMF